MWQFSLDTLYKYFFADFDKFMFLCQCASEFWVEKKFYFPQLPGHDDLGNKWH